MRGDVFDPAGEVADGPVGEIEQRRRHGAKIGELAVEALLAGPARFAEILEPDHAGAAFERVKGAAQRRQAFERIGGRAEFGQGLARGGEHLARLLEEDLAHLVVLRQRRAGAGRHEVEPHRRADAPAHRRRPGFEPDRVGRGRDEVGQRLGQLAARRRFVAVVVGEFERLLRFGNGRGQRRLVGSLRFVRQALEVARDFGQRHLVACRTDREQLRLLDQALLDRRGGARRGGARRRTRPFGAAHHRAQHARVGIEGEQRLGHLRLHAEHVDQEAERAEVAREAVEHPRLRDVLGLDRGRGQAVDLVAHAQQRGRRVAHAQHREHAAHRRELARHRDQHVSVFGLAEVLVDQLLGLGQAGAQLLHHAAHGLAIRHAPVELFHPRLERVGRAALAHRREPVGQALHALGQPGVVEIDVVERRFDVEQAGRDLHRQRRRRGAAELLRLRDRLLQFGGEPVTEREQALQRFADQRELLRQTGQAVHLAAGHGRPGVFGRHDALLGLREHGRIEAPERADGVVDRHVVREPVDLAHRGQARRAPAIAG